MDVFKQFATDDRSELEGSWQKLGDARFLVARAGNKNYTRALTKALEAHAETLQAKKPNGEPTDEADRIDQQIMVDVIAETVLLGWENVEYKGSPLSYSVESAKMLLQHKDFRGRIQGMATNFENFRAKSEVEQAKN